MTEQEEVDLLRSYQDPQDRRNDNRIDSCGHKNCQFHGICVLMEFKNLMVYLNDLGGIGS